MKNKVGIYEFIMMPGREQANYLWEHSEYIANSIRNGKRFQLRQLHDFFVEIELKSEENHTVLILSPFKKGDRLEPYLEQLDYTEWL